MMDAFTHPRLPGALFRPIRRNPTKANAALKVPAVADALGTTRREVREAIKVGLLEAGRTSHGDLVVEEGELARFAKDLRPVVVTDAPELIEVAEPSTVAVGEEEKPETAPKPAFRLVAASTNAEGAAPVADVAHVDCLECGMPLAVAESVVSFRCPGCSYPMRMVYDEDASPPEEPEAPRRFFGFLRGGR
jgi:hypothetical protein